jgi:hypothetical protein
MNTRKGLIAFTVLVIGIAVISRLVDHPANFAPIGAVAILAGYYLKSRNSWLLPLAAMLVSDLIIGTYQWQVMASVYVSYLALWGLGRYAKGQDTKVALLPATLLGSSVHFVATNFAVWAFTGLYAKTLSGLLLSYTMAIPFFKWTLAGDAFYMVVLVSMVEGARYVGNHLAQTREAVSIHTN